VVSNAYRLGLGYVPSATPITQLAVKGTVALTAADAGDRLLYSADGRTWQERAFRPYGEDHGVFTELDTVGWFVVASSAGQRSAGGGPDVVRTVLLGLAAVVPIAGAVLVVRLPSPMPAPPPRPRPGARKKAAKRRR
jgi:hypothetical protein